MNSFHLLLYVPGDVRYRLLLFVIIYLLPSLLLLVEVIGALNELKHDSGLQLWHHLQSAVHLLAGSFFCKSLNGTYNGIKIIF